ncbi:cytochrome P450 [Thozetella sp. PMI_491]|nr:cytochrome P450 [Thozetella sp. PMI_491]
MWPWMVDRARRQNSSLVQVFMFPFCRPFLFLADAREGYDILSRRTNEFDRSLRNAESFSGIIPEHRIAMVTSDPRFKRNKELMKDLMTPAFLNNVSAGSVHAVILKLIDLWTAKSTIAQNLAFKASRDISEAALDIVWAAAFGGPITESITHAKLGNLSERKHSKLPDIGTATYEFPSQPPTPRFQALINVVAAVEISFTTPVPRLHLALLKSFTQLGRDFATKDRTIREEIQKSVARLSIGTESDQNVKSAMDHMVLREMRVSEKASRASDFHSAAMYDELFGYLIAGHDTSATTLAWTVKFLSDHPRVQTTLRKHLRSIYPEASAQKRFPEAAEITKTPAPFLDAFLEESLRCAHTAPAVMRQATVDTTILGHFVPKGTNIFISARGPGITEPALQECEAVRSPSSQATRARVGVWDDADVTLFRPERWLKWKSLESRNRDLDDSGDKDKDFAFADAEFDPRAGPILVFGAGPRGCAGRRLAYLEMRIAVVLLVWAFDFAKCVPELSSYESELVMSGKPKQCFINLTPLSEVGRNIP